MTTANELVQFTIGLANSGMGVDKDGFAGTQCADLLTYPSKHFFGVDLWGNAADLLDSAEAAGWEVHRMPTDENPRAGAFFNMNAWFGGVNYGHCGIVIEDSDGITMRTVEQNIDGNADALIVGGPARYNNRGFEDVIGWFYPPYSDGEAPATPADVTPTSEEIELTSEIGTFTVGTSAINVRREPNLNSEIVHVYEAGDTVNYDSKGSANGYRWISYIGQSGNRNYLVIGQTDEAGNRITLWGDLS